MPSPHAPPIVAILKAFKHGLQYGVKIRLPHALIMTFLFSSNLPLRDKLERITKLIVGHAKTLGTFAAVYTMVVEGLKLTNKLSAQPPHIDMVDLPAGRPLKPYHSALAGALGGYMIWGEYSSVNYQIIQYLLPRLLISYSQILARKGVFPFKNFSFGVGGGEGGGEGGGKGDVKGDVKGVDGSNDKNKTLPFGVYPLLATVVWAGVMYLYEEEKETMPKGLRVSMDEIYDGKGVSNPLNPGSRNRME